MWMTEWRPHITTCVTVCHTVTVHPSHASSLCTHHMPHHNMCHSVSHIHCALCHSVLHCVTLYHTFTPTHHMPHHIHTHDMTRLPCLLVRSHITHLYDYVIKRVFLSHGLVETHIQMLLMCKHLMTSWHANVSWRAWTCAVSWCICVSRYHLAYGLTWHAGDLCFTKSHQTFTLEQVVRPREVYCFMLSREVYCFILYTRGWARLETILPVALGSSPELSLLLCR